jgi:hypothetical protein
MAILSFSSMNVERLCAEFQFGVREAVQISSFGRVHELKALVCSGLVAMRTG